MLVQRLDTQLDLPLFGELMIVDMRQHHLVLESAILIEAANNRGNQSVARRKHPSQRKNKKMINTIEALIDESQRGGKSSPDFD